MIKLRLYVLKNLSSVFFPIFLTLFAITSIIFLVKIASLTSVITMNFSELLLLYSLKIPLILFYTLPVTFFVSSVINISKISSEYELIVITSFGLSPLKILKILIPVSLLTSLLLMIISFILIPKSTYIENLFLNKKKQEVKFNIKPSEYGQKFGPWYMYVEGKEKNDYKNMMLYKNNNGNDTFIIAKTARLHNNANSFTLELLNGTSSIIADDLTYVNFQKMTLNNQLPQIKQLKSLKDLINYWIKNRSYKKSLTLIRNVLISLLPVISLLFYIALGYYNPRHQKNNASSYSIVFVILYILLLQQLSLSINFSVLFYLPMSWIFMSIFIYYIRIKKYY